MGATRAPFFQPMTNPAKLKAKRATGAIAAVAIPGIAYGFRTPPRAPPPGPDEGQSSLAPGLRCHTAKQYKRPTNHLR